MDNKLIILGSGAAPGVPSLASGWGSCNPKNPKNRRRRTGTYVEIAGVKFLIDTSADIHWQLMDNDIRYVDAVLYTHAHADHLHGIDDLRDLNRISKMPLDLYANIDTIQDIKTRFSYLVCDKEHPNNPLFKPSLILNPVEHGNPFYIKGVKIVPIDLFGHPVHSNGYIFNDELVYIADCLQIGDESLRLIKTNPKLMVMPLTILETKWEKPYHMGLEKMLEYVNVVKPCKCILNHMATECDYDNVNNLTPENVFPAYDNMVIKF
ncbi:MAG: MBL fold metallo-hydrolase [Alphaproteobacteria bacterium]|nr:MBL fold metallo-hydrolase [Alphaproteobacteria bacterium]